MKMGGCAMKIGRKELLLMSYLRNNARENLTMLSKKTQIPVSTIFDKLRSLQKSVILKHTSLLDFSKLGFQARATIMLKVPPNEQVRLKQHLLTNHNINSLSKINNGFDFMAEGVFRTINDIAYFLDILAANFKVEQNQVYYIIEDLKREGFLDNEQLIDLII